MITLREQSTHHRIKPPFKGAVLGVPWFQTTYTIPFGMQAVPKPNPFLQSAALLRSALIAFLLNFRAKIEQCPPMGW